MELGNCQEAHEELGQISPALHAHPDVLAARLEICSKAGQWDKAAETARALVQIRRKEPQFWISLAYATRRMPGGGLPQAQEILMNARPLFPKHPLIAYNLACYSCQRGNLEAARYWLKTASDLGNANAVKVMALNDLDLKPLWKEIGGS